MTPNATHHQPTPSTPADAADAADMPAVITLAETLSELADLVHRHRLAIAALRQSLDELADELALREAQAVMAAEGTSAEKRKAFVAVQLAADGDYQALRRKERDLRRELLERQADIERAQVRIRITLALLPTAQAVDALSVSGEGHAAGGADAGAGDGEPKDAADDRPSAT